MIVEKEYENHDGMCGESCEIEIDELDCSLSCHKEESDSLKI